MDKEKINDIDVEEDCCCSEDNSCGCNLDPITPEEDTCGCNDGCGCEDDSCGCEDDGCGCEEDSCGCGCEEDEEARYVDFEDEAGNVVPYEIVDELEFEGNEYVLVQNPDDNSVYILKANAEDPEELEIPSEEEFEAVSAYLETLSKE